jgi:hypothetical protein
MSGQLLPYDDKIKERFVNFYDSVLMQIELKYHCGSKPTLAIDITAKDESLPSESAFISAFTNVRLVVYKVHEFKVMEGKHTTIQVLSQGLNVLRKDNLVAVEFGGFVDPETIDEFRESEAFAIGEDIRIIVGDRAIPGNQ